MVPAVVVEQLRAGMVLPSMVWYGAPDDISQRGKRKCLCFDGVGSCSLKLSVPSPECFAISNRHVHFGKGKQTAVIFAYYLCIYTYRRRLDYCCVFALLQASAAVSNRKRAAKRASDRSLECDALSAVAATSRLTMPVTFVCRCLLGRVNIVLFFLSRAQPSQAEPLKGVWATMDSIDEGLPTRAPPPPSSGGCAGFMHVHLLLF